ncbi:MAG: glycosyltransferase family 2 protein [Candidatus Scalinduaceae bacterium]
MSIESKVSVIIPVYNEEGIIREAIKSIQRLNKGYEIMVVDDGSIDDTFRIAVDTRAKVVQHRQNKGYGAALKTGANKATNDILVFFDGDGQHKPEDIERLLQYMQDSDLVMGARTNLSEINLIRMPGRFILKILANYLSGNRVPDVNSGLLAIKKELFLKYIPLLPDGFSCSTTILLAMLNGRYKVDFCPIKIGKRKGKSTVRPIRDGFNTVMSMIRLIALFNPLRIFLPVSLFLLAAGITYGLYKFITVNFGLSVGSLLLILSGVVVFLFGILCDQISSLRLERYK